MKIDIDSRKVFDKHISEAELNIDSYVYPNFIIYLTTLYGLLEGDKEEQINLIKKYLKTIKHVEYEANLLTIFHHDKNITFVLFDALLPIEVLSYKNYNDYDYDFDFYSGEYIIKTKNTFESDQPILPGIELEWEKLPDGEIIKHHGWYGYIYKY